MQQRGENRDYIPRRERNVKERMSEGASLKDGVSGRMEVTQRMAMYRSVRKRGESHGDMMAPYSFFEI